MSTSRARLIIVATMASLALLAASLVTVTSANGVGGPPVSAKAESPADPATAAYRDYYGAISVAFTGGAVGMSYDYSTVWGAKNRAQRECRSRSYYPGSCHRIAWVRNGCLAVAVRWDGSNIARYGWAVRNSKRAARWAALDKCGYGCVRRAYTCTTR